MRITRLEEIDAELEQLRAMLCHDEEWTGGCDCTALRARIHALTVERDDIPAQRRG